MAEPIYQTLLGLYLTLEEYRKHVKPGQKVTVWMPPNFEERKEGVAGEAWGPGLSEPIVLVKLANGDMIEVTERNVFCFEPRR